MRIGADRRIRVRKPIGINDDAGEIFDVDLMHDARAGRYDPQAGQRRLAPLEKSVALAVAFELDLRVLRERVARAEIIGLHRMVDDELDGLQRIDRLWIA